jgi:hypothetical protein
MLYPRSFLIINPTYVGASGSVTDISVDEVFSAADQMDWMQSASAVMGAYKPANA